MLTNGLFAVRFQKKEVVMPIYEFRCQRCHHIFELLALKREEMVEVKCPKCGSFEIERVMSRIGFTADRSEKPRIINRECLSGTCSTIEVPGPEK